MDALINYTINYTYYVYRENVKSSYLNILFNEIADINSEKYNNCNYTVEVTPHYDFFYGYNTNTFDIKVYNDSIRNEPDDVKKSMFDGCINLNHFINEIDDAYKQLH